MCLQTLDPVGGYAIPLKKKCGMDVSFCKASDEARLIQATDFFLLCYFISQIWLLVCVVVAYVCLDHIVLTFLCRLKINSGDTMILAPRLYLLLFVSLELQALQMSITNRSCPFQWRYHRGIRFSPCNTAI